MSALLEAKEITKIYARAQRPSLNKVSFSVSKSEFIAIMGASGSGKTTLPVSYTHLNRERKETKRQ